MILALERLEEQIRKSKKRQAWVKAVLVETSNTQHTRVAKVGKEVKKFKLKWSIIIVPVGRGSDSPQKNAIVKNEVRRINNALIWAHMQAPIFAPY